MFAQSVCPRPDRAINADVLSFDVVVFRWPFVVGFGTTFTLIIKMSLGLTGKY